MTETLIERLRQNANSLRQGGNVHRRFHEDYEEAADALERMTERYRVLDEIYGHTVGDLNEAQAALTVAQARIERLERGIKAYLDGDYPNPRACRPLKCDHGRHYWEECAECDTAYFEDLLKGSVLFPDQEGETPETCPADSGEWCPDPAIDRAPEPLRRLGEFLSRVLDEDHWATAEPMLLALAPFATEERLRQALRPFALVASAVDNGTLFSGAPRIDDAEPVAIGGQGETWFTMGDLRKARAALSPDRHDKGDRLEVGR